MKSWIKLYTEITRDPDMGTLTWAQRGIWSALLALAGEIDARDELDHETGELDTPAKTAWRLRCEPGEFTEALSAFTERDMVEERNGVLYVTNYARHLPEVGRSQSAASAWRTQIFERDDYTCQECGQRGGKLRAHHIQPWFLDQEHRFVLSNGVTLCAACHKARHSTGWKRRAVAEKGA